MDSLADRLRGEITEFDGKAVTILSEAERRLGDEPGYIDTLMLLAAEDDAVASSGATWLIKSALDRGEQFSPDQVSALVGHLSAIEDWQAQLHICQSIRHLTLSATDVDALVAWLLPLTRHDRPFLRAWSVDAICHVGAMFPRHRQAAQDCLEVAQQDDAASVRARARNLAASFK